uniref:glutathione transferase n=1 Tax=Ditylenchus dipsaci TaxID=166011 RepID=A0A915EPB0_9BILA
MVHYKLSYFDVRGLGETARLILTHANQPFDDERFTFETWPANKSKMLYGKVPVLEVDGKPLAESFAIFRYLAKQYGLLGKDDWEQAKVDEFSNVHKDIATEIGAYIRVYAGYGQGDKEQLYKDVFLPGMQKYLPLYVKRSRNLVLALLPRVVLHGWTLSKQPELEQYIQRVHSQPTIKKYVEGRKHSVI